MAMIARLTFDAKYQKLCRWAGSSLLTRSMAVVKRIFAAARVMERRFSSALLESNLMIARWRVTSAAKYARWRDPRMFISFEPGGPFEKRTS